MPWLRLYVDILDDPKVQRLDPALFKFWINLLCFVKRNGGVTGNVSCVSFALRETEDTVSSAFQSLEKAGLLDRYKGSWEPHNWRKRQYVSDTSTDRVKRFRKRRRNVSETPPDTDTDTDTDTDIIEGASAAAPPPKKPNGKGSRIGSWEPSYEDDEFCRSLGLDQNEIFDRFRDYWAAQPGAKGVKLDWSATWRNWCRRSLDYQHDRRN